MKYEYCTTWDDKYDTTLGACPHSGPKGDGWEFVAFSVGASGSSDDFEASGAILWKRPVQ